MRYVYSAYELTKANHLRYWFNWQNQQLRRSHPYEVAHCCIGDAEVDNGGSFVESLMATAKTLHVRHGNDLRFFLSGGLDSEVALRMFHQQGLAVDVVVLEFTDDLNRPDVDSAQTLCAELNILPKIVTIDPVAFFHSGDWQRIAETYQCYTFYQQLLLSIAERSPKPMITIDEIEIQKHHNNWWLVKKEDQDGCWHRFVGKTGILAYNNFYTYDPTTILHFLQSPTVDDLIHDRLPGKLGWTSSKHKIYTELTAFDMKKRDKRHGMEKMMHIWEYVQTKTSLILHDDPAEFLFDSKLLLNNLQNNRSMTCNIA